MLLVFYLYCSVHYAMSSSYIRLRVDIGRKGCKVQGGFQMRAMHVKKSNDPFMFRAIIDSEIWIWILYMNNKYGYVILYTVCFYSKVFSG